MLYVQLYVNPTRKKQRKADNFCKFVTHFNLTVFFFNSEPVMRSNPNPTDLTIFSGLLIITTYMPLLLYKDYRINNVKSQSQTLTVNTSIPIQFGPHTDRCLCWQAFIYCSRALHPRHIPQWLYATKYLIYALKYVLIFQWKKKKCIQFIQ